MFDNRMNDRSRATGKIPVISRSTGKQVGLLVDVSSEGMLVMTKEDLAENRVLELALELPDQIEVGGQLDLDAEVIWTKHSVHLGIINNGMRLRYLSTEAAEKLQKVISFYTP
jgi:hypothetical protein